MTGKISVVIEQDEHGCYAWCPELKGCQSQGDTVEETLANIREAIELYLETLTDEERSAALSREILTDRKSTRLNSSHLGISYAVFFLIRIRRPRRSTLFPYTTLFRSNIREAIELYLETLTDEERSAALSREILTTAIEVRSEEHTSELQSLRHLV